ncbi:MAG TPA: aldolase/citrate lyase family protein [Chloroflexota bacterium]|nr:aldolase/citrate lyase family protein [Chloroflexota bacterium]
MISGPMVIYDSPSLAEQVGHLGFDFTWLDWQHGQWSEHTLNDALARFLAAPSTPLVRVKGQEPGTINRVLDMGAMGVVVPYVQDAPQARAAVQAAFYPPLGIRSGGGVRLGLIGDSAQDYFAHANDEVLLGVMVETERAISQVEEIMRVPGVGFVLIGPGDLLIDVRANGHDPAHHERLVQQVAEASKRTGTPAGYVTQSPDEARTRVEQGFRFINYGSDNGALLGGLRQAAAEAQGWG